MRYRIYSFKMFCLLLIFCFSGTISASSAEVIPVSPVLSEGVAVCESCRPTFSWSADSDTQGYKIRIFQVEDENFISYDEMQVQSEPVLQALIPAPATTWIPGSVDTGLKSGNTYVWYVQAYDELGVGPWSQGAFFKIDPAQTIGLFDKALSDEIKAFNAGEMTSDSGLLTFTTLMHDLFENQQTDVSGVLTTESETTPLLRGTIEGETFNNTFFGIYAGDSLDVNSGGLYNSFFGYGAGNKTTSGQLNTFIGDGSGQNNITGDYNTFLGAQAGEKNTTGHRNTFVGAVAGNDNTTGKWNTYVGVDAGRDSADGSYNVCMGFEAGMDHPYFGNTLLGSRAGKVVSGAMYNCFLGHEAGLKNTSGSLNTFLGAFAGNNNTSGAGNVFVGYLAGGNETGSNKLYIDNSNTLTPLVYGEFDHDLLRVNGTLEISSISSPSDRRLKKEIDPIENALEKIQALEGVSFQWRKDKFPDRWFAQGRQLGFIAQEVEKVLPELVNTDAKGYKSVEYIQLIPVLLEGMKEQQRRLEEQRKEIDTLKESLKKLIQEHNQDGAS